MAIKEYLKNGKVLYSVNVRMTTPSLGKRIQRSKFGIESLKEAQKIENRLTRETQKLVVQKEQQGIPWSEVVDGYEMALRDGTGSDRVLQRTTITDNISALRMYTAPWMKIPANQISRGDVKILLREMEAQGKSASRVNNVKAVINGAFNWAIETRFVKGILASPTIGIGVKSSKESVPEILTLTECRNLLKLAQEQNHPWYPVWAMALLTGCRSGELLAIEWSDVNWDNKRIMISKSYCGRTRVTKSTKAGYWREVPMSSELERLIRDLRGTSDNKFILPRLTGWGFGRAAKILRMFCIGNGLPSVKFHTLRACFGTQLIKDGVAPAIVMKICGWKDLQTMQRYIRLAGIEIEGATDTLKLLPDREVFGRVVELFTPKQ